MFESTKLAALCAGVIAFLLAACAQTPRTAQSGQPQTSVGETAENQLDTLSHANPVTAAVETDDDRMVIHMIDVGQGEAFLIEFPCAAVMYDVGGEHHNNFGTDERVLAYLDEFFARRADLNHTLAAVFVSHPHGDHAHGLPVLSDPANGIIVRNFIDDGKVRGPKDGDDQYVFRAWAQQHARYRGVTVEDLDGTDGVQDDIIDPLNPGNCGGLDPDIRVMWGAMPELPEDGWSDEDFINPNNHSLVVKITFGKATALFVGDLETAAEDSMVAHYAESDALDVDVYQASHHGARNGSGEGLLGAMTPAIVLIPMGDPNRRKGSRTAYSYGHPNGDAVDRCLVHVTRDRSTVKKVKVGKGQRSFRTITLSKAIFGTGWDGAVRVFATAGGDYRVLTER